MEASASRIGASRFSERMVAGVCPQLHGAMEPAPPSQDHPLSVQSLAFACVETDNVGSCGGCGESAVLRRSTGMETSTGMERSARARRASMRQSSRAPGAGAWRTRTPRISSRYVVQLREAALASDGAWARCCSESPRRYLRGCAAPRTCGVQRSTLACFSALRWVSCLAHAFLRYTCPRGGELGSNMSAQAVPSSRQITGVRPRVYASRRQRVASTIKIC